MSRFRLQIAAASVMLAFTLACAVPAFAQGTTSGPAAGGNVAPGGTAQKDGATSPKDQSGQAAGTQMQPGAVSAGAPGVAAKPGSESGPAAAKTSR